MKLLFIAIITGALALIGSFTYFQKTKQRLLILYRLDEIEKKQDKHNSVIKKTYKLEGKCALLDNRQSVSEHRIADLEKKG